MTHKKKSLWEVPVVWGSIALYVRWINLYLSVCIHCKMKLSVLEEMLLLQNVIIMCQNSEWGGEGKRASGRHRVLKLHLRHLPVYTAHIIRHLSTERIAEKKKEPTSISRKIFLSSNFILLKGCLILVSAISHKISCHVVYLKQNLI